MLTLYLVCLLFGGIFLVVTLLSGTDVDSGGMDFHGDWSTDFHGDLSGDMHGDLSADASVDGEGVADAVKFLSFRTIVFFLAFFGLTGVCLSWLDTPALVNFATAVVMGAFSGVLVHRIMRYLKQTEAGSVPNLKTLEGMRAQVSIGISREQRGKIVVNTGEQFLQMLAKVAQEARKDQFAPGEIVTVVRVEDDLALVAEEDFIR